ncbi:DUF1800 domain-containing protein [Asticcacaulis sp. SL142]|uniref:DUF1800 domain-containing protein n=1 Tax=Asticcacaulis sp. SL142 TaxID=2995155 RepID=UPI00226C7F09|nr:DUF1800 domain-containing protein [Asticcacaulis sp. SL142]WAC47101.1 DUF1800 domain-containing protein [Asticcacaulis sp. SL142]
MDTAETVVPDTDANGADRSERTPDIHPAAVAIAAASLLLSACGGGGGGGSGGGSGSGVSPPPPPITPVSTSQAARFLLQAQFSASESDVSSVQSLGISGWLDARMNEAPGPTGVAWLDSRGHNAITSEQTYFNPVFGDWMIWNQVLTSPDQLRKRIALALSEHFVVSLNPIDGFYPPYCIAAYWDMLARNAFGNFRTLLEDVTLSVAMGMYLNTLGNEKENAQGRQPDENYAREVMQLFTLGLYQLNNDGSIKTDLLTGAKLETYTQSDVTNLARVFTGYERDLTGVTTTPNPVPGLNYPIPNTRYVTNPMKLTAGKHSMLEVNFLGTNIPANTEGTAALKTALDALFNHPNVGPFFARAMIQRLVTSNPSAAYINRVASAFNNNGSGVRGDLKAFWKALFNDPEALTVPTADTAGKLREPMIRFVQLLRTAGFASWSGKYEIYDLTNPDFGLGQSPLRSGSVFNFFRPGYVPPNTTLADRNAVAPEFQLVNESSIASYLNFTLHVMKNGYADIDLTYTRPLTMVTDTTALVNWLNLYMTGDQLSPATVSLIKTALDSVPVSATSTDAQKIDRMWSAFLLVIASPEYLIQK